MNCGIAAVTRCLRYQYGRPHSSEGVIYFGDGVTDLRYATTASASSGLIRN